MRLYLMFRSRDDVPGPPAAYAFHSHEMAVKYASGLSASDKKEHSVIHEIEIDPDAGFQSCNATMVNADGTRHIDEYERILAGRDADFHNVPQQDFDQLAHKLARENLTRYE